MRLNNETGEITCFQGDSGKFYLSGLPASCNVYFSVYNEKREEIFELQYTAESDGTLTMFIPAESTDKLVVNKKEESEEYYYSLKVVTIDTLGNRIETTCLLNNHDESEPNVMTVYPKRTEGGTSVQQSS